MSRQSDLDNHANQCNPNNDEYWNSRDLDNPNDQDYDVGDDGYIEFDYMYLPDD